MEPAITATFTIANWIAKGLADGSFERFGGVIREAATGRIVTFLRETSSTVASLPQQFQIAQSALMVGSGASVLGLGVAVMSFAVLNHRLNELEQRLKQAEELLKKIDRKIDLGFYANFRAALILTENAFTMSRSENRDSMAIQAINRFLEAEHIYTDYTDRELEQKSQIADEYLLTLSIAYIAEARCHLELKEPETALHRFQEGAKVVRSRIQKYVDLLLTSNPAAYLQPEFEEQIDLRRLTRIYQWSNPTLDENAVFQMQRKNFVEYVRDPNKWVNSLPSAILDRVEVKKGLFGPSSDELKKEAIKRLPNILQVIESMIETNLRFEAYQAEVLAIAQLGISFHDWLKLAPSEIQPDRAELMYIIPSKPLDLAIS